jgi:hypothetical protein
MGKPLVPNKVKKEFKRLIQQLVSDLSQPLIVVQESPMFVDCPNCIWDSINKKSSNVFDASFSGSVTIFSSTDQERTISPVSFDAGRCPVCIGEGQLFTTQEVCISAMINFISGRGPDGRFIELPAGKEGENLVIVKTLACHYELIENNHIFVIHNNVKCEKYNPPIVRGLGGEEAVVEVLLQTTEAKERISGKFGGGDKLDRDDDPRRRIKAPTDIRILRGQLKGRDS